MSRVSLLSDPPAPIITKVNFTAGVFTVRWRSGDGTNGSNIDASISPNNLNCTRNGSSYTCQYKPENRRSYTFTVSSRSCDNQTSNGTSITLDLGMLLANVIC